MHEHHVDVARVVELAAAELAHADHRDRDARCRDVDRDSRGTPARAPRARRRRRAGRRCRAGRGRRCARSAGASSAAARGRDRRRRPARASAPKSTSTCNASSQHRDGVGSRSSAANSECDATATATRRSRSGRDRSRRRAADARQMRSTRSPATTGSASDPVPRERSAHRPMSVGRARGECRVIERDRGRRPSVSRTEPWSRDARRRDGLAERRDSTGGVVRSQASCARDAATVSTTRRYPGRDASVARRPPPRSTSSSAISTATSRGSSTTYEAAEAAGCDLVVFPELDDHRLPARGPAAAARVRRPGRAKRSTSSRRAPARCVAVVGFPQRGGDDLYNAAAVCAHGRVHGVLPQAAAARTTRCSTSSATSSPGPSRPLFVVAGVKVGVSICEDAWSPTGPIARAGRGRRRGDRQPQRVAVLRGPARRARDDARDAARPTRSVPIVYANLVGGQDELVFDGASLVFDEQGTVARGSSSRICSSSTRRRRRSVEAPARPSICARRRCGVDSDVHTAAADRAAGSSREHEVYEALVLGTRDYVRKNGFTDVLIALSGGIDSSLVAAIAVDALGAEHVVGVLMPSRYSSEGSITDADGARREPRHPHLHDPDRTGPRRVRGDARARVRRRPRPASPTRTCRRASAATC